MNNITINSNSNDIKVAAVLREVRQKSFSQEPL